MLIDIVEVRAREGCWGSSATEACVLFDPASRPDTPLDPRSSWIAYGIVVDTTGDGHPDQRFGIDNAKEDGGLRMWQTDLASGATRLDDSLESGVMDAEFPKYDPDNPLGHIFVRRPGPVFRFYVWASAIVDGRIIATDYAPGRRLDRFPAGNDMRTDLAQAVPLDVPGRPAREQSAADV